MQFFKKFLNVFLALLPIMVIVLTVHLFFYPMDSSILIKFFVSVVLICFGEVLLLTGIDSTIMPMGDLMVNSVNKASKFIIFILFAMVFGFCATVAEPDVTVFSNQIMSSGIGISRTLLIFFIGSGVGIFIALGIFRIIKNIEVKYVYTVLFAVIFLLCTQVKPEHIAIAFDAGGATTGIITAPFLLAISAGVSRKFNKKNTNREVFGMLGLASLGPVVAVLLFFVCFGDKAETLIESSAQINIFLNVLKSASLAIIPLTIVFYIYDLIFIKLPMKRKLEFLFGLGLTFVGLFMFLFGIDFGISEMGTMIGNFISTLSVPVIIVLCLVLGFIITFSEPSVIVLSKQVQSATKGSIPYYVVMLAIAFSMAIAILLSALKIIFNINFFYIILIGYLIALVLMYIVPSIFTSLAFDSGGVASGPMTSAFILPIMIALASQTTSAVDGFGLIGIVAMSPIVVLQLLGVVYRIENAVKERNEKKKALRISYSTEMYSNMEALEEEYELLKQKEEKQHER